MVNGDTDALGLLLPDTSELELVKGESSTGYGYGLALPNLVPHICSTPNEILWLTPDSDVVSLSWASDSWSQLLQGLGSGSEGLLGSSHSSRLLLSWLVELHNGQINGHSSHLLPTAHTQVFTRRCQSFRKWFFGNWLLCLT